MPKKVCMFVYNNCSKDARVLKEAKSLVDAGYKVRIIAVLDSVTSTYEIRDGIEIVRVEKNPIHYSILSGRIFFEMFKKKPKSYLSYLKSKATVSNKDVTLVSGENDSVIDDKSSLNYRIATVGFRKTLAEEYKMRPAKLFFYNWTLFFLQSLKKGFKLTIHALIRKMLLSVHKPLCFYDFLIKSVRINAESPSDIYHGHDLHTVPAAYHSAKRTNAKVIYDAHELYTEMSTLTPVERKLYAMVERKYAPKVDAIITVNKSIAKELARRYKIKEPNIIFNCPDVKNSDALDERDLIRGKLNIPGDVPVILYQGGFTVNRGLFNLIKAAQYIDRGVIVFMGWGKIENELKGLARQLKLKKKVLFIPGVPQVELLNHSKSADVGIIPYQFVGLNNYYTSPNKLFEYINAKVPIAGSDFPELKRVINKYEIGETFDPESPESIAKAVNIMLADKNKLKRMKKNTEQAAIDFRWENEEKKLWEVYKGLD